MKQHTKNTEKAYLTAKDLERLQPGECLNDAIINSYLDFVVKRSERSPLLPTIVDLRRKTISYYDSLLGAGANTLRIASSETMAATHSNDVSEDVETDDVPAQQIVLVDSVTKASNYAIISEAEINEEMSRIVQEVHEVLGKIYASSILNTALMFYKWDKDFFTEKFFEGGDPAGFFLALQLPATGLSCKSEKEGVSECGICSEDKSLTGFQCGHFFCGECWSQYLSKVVLDGNFLILCPEFKCKSLLDNDSVFSLARSSEVSAKYKKLLVKSFVQHKKQVAACPRTAVIGSLNYLPNSGLQSAVPVASSIASSASSPGTIHWIVPAYVNG
uniref:RBR-type E3 ubiquitin transferase n=1 Tax=Ditylenchus dipsaci TaxID=166011 RepID=A0A915DCM3_9BILA